MRAPELVLVDDIVVQKRMRHADDQKVSALAASMRDIGLRTPISVRVVEEMELDGEIVHGVPVLITGATRLAAAKRLGWEKIDCFIVDSDDIDAKLWEIDENLARAELSPAEKRDHLRRRKDLWERRQKENPVAHDAPVEIGYKKPPRRPRGFAAETSAATGLSKSQINRLLAEPKPAAPRSAPSNFPQDDHERSTNWRRSFERLWNSAPTLADKEWAREWIDQPIMDRSAAE